LALFLLAAGVYAGFQAGQERRALLQPTQPVPGAESFGIQSQADRSELRQLHRQAPRSAERKPVASSPERDEPKPGAGEPQSSPEGDEEEPLLSAEVPGVTAVELPGTDSLLDTDALP
jgi:hypothetical protein